MKKIVLKLVSFLAVILVILAAFYFGYSYMMNHYNVTTVFVEGNVHYTEDQIKEMVMEGRFGNNSFYLSHKYKNKEIKDVPFIETMSVTIVAPDTIKISVYEKTLAGYIKYLGRYVYFDKDGVVVEVSSVRTEGIPEVIGLFFDYVVLYEPLPVENKDLFQTVLNITQLMTKYGVDADKMYFKNDDEIILYHDKVAIQLGSQKDIDIKIMNLPSLLANLEGMEGVLRMEKYDENTKKVTFEPSN